MLSPYDVTLGGFAGGGINAVTKSGTNTFEGSAYTFVQNEQLVGKINRTLSYRLGIERERVDEFANRIYGFTADGLLDENKLFFFSNVEIQRDATPRPFQVLNYTFTPGRASVSDLENLRNFVRSEYNYDHGSFGSTTGELDGLKIFGKLNYNIIDDHRLVLRHQYTKAEQFSRYSGSDNTISISTAVTPDGECDLVFAISLTKIGDIEI